MLDGLSLSKAKLVVELGPGTGVFTEKLLELIGSKTRLLVIEINPEFYNSLKNKITDSRVTLINGSAADIQFYLRKMNATEVDYIISSLPLAVLPLSLRSRIVISARETLKQKGKYVQFQYTLQSQKMLEKVFNNVQIKTCLLNLPPAFIYSCSME